MLLRTALGAFVLYQSVISLAAGSNATLESLVVDLLFAVTAILLIVGLLTPYAAAALGALEIVAHSFFSPANCRLCACTSTTVFAAALTTAIVILGPGAWSMDARLFGLREILIPGPRAARSLDRRTER